jgi:hypothetical protein
MTGRGVLARQKTSLREAIILPENHSLLLSEYINVSEELPIFKYK